MHLMHNPWLRAKSHCIISLPPKLYVGGKETQRLREWTNSPSAQRQGGEMKTFPFKQPPQQRQQETSAQIKELAFLKQTQWGFVIISAAFRF